MPVPGRSPRRGASTRATSSTSTAPSISATRSLPNAGETICELRRKGSRIVYVTNKPLETAVEYADKLTRLGLPTARMDVVTSVDALVDYLHREHPGARLLAVAEASAIDELEAAGFELTKEPSRAQVVIVSFDRTFDYEKLNAAFQAVRYGGAAIVATNPDPYCPTPEGGIPDCAAMLAAIEACSGATAEAIVGKPSVHMARALLGRLGMQAGDVAVVGDRLITDMAMARSLGMTGVLVLTGATRADNLFRSPGPAPSPDRHAQRSFARRPFARRARRLVVTRGGTPINFIFMLTHNDTTVPDAAKVYERLRGTSLRHVGFKDIGATVEELADVTARGTRRWARGLLGGRLDLERVRTSVPRIRVRIGVDWVMGGTHASEGVRESFPAATSSTAVPRPDRRPPEHLVGQRGRHRPGREGAHGDRGRLRPRPACLPAPERGSDRSGTRCRRRLRRSRHRGRIDRHCRADQEGRLHGGLGLHDRRGDLRGPASGRSGPRRPDRSGLEDGGSGVHSVTDDPLAKRRSRRTLADRVRDSLLSDLFSDIYVVGDQLPNEDELAARFEVSRATVREAVRSLVEAGYLIRRHGTGTFVTATTRHRHTLNANLSYTAMIRQAGLKPGRRLLRNLCARLALKRPLRSGSVRVPAGAYRADPDR